MRAIRVHELGGPEVLRYEEVSEPQADPGTVVVEVAAAGLNFIDTYQRTGLYPMDLPFTPGLEGAGTVVEIGDEVADFAVGDRVAWSGALGSYADYLQADPAGLVTVPPGVELQVAAAVMLQGMTAHYLVTDTYPLGAGQRCLVQAGAGGVGLLLIQMAKRIGAEVFTTVGSRAKAELATAVGADHVILYQEENFAEAVEGIAGPKAIDVVYDGVGKATFDAGLDLLRPRGMMVTFGNASGPVDPVSPLRLSRGGSLFLTRPSLFDYIATRDELQRRSADLFRWIAAGELDVTIGARVPVAEAAEAHRMLEGRKTTGKVILVP